MRRQLTFADLSDAIRECELLHAQGYVRNGNWSLGQICCHLRLTIDANLNGYPIWMTVIGYPLRPFFRWLLLPRLLAGNSPSGFKTAGIFVPPEELRDAQEIELLKDCIACFFSSDKPLNAHPGFGRMTRDQFHQFHVAHAAHHLGFLSPADTATKRTCQ